MKLMNAETVRLWLDDRMGIGSIAAVARKKEIPVHRHSIWYYFGGMTLFLFSVQVGTEIAGVVPPVGRPMLRFLRGGGDVTGATLTRFFGFHVAVLPAITTLIIGAHLALVQKYGMSVPPGLEGQNIKKMKFFPNFFLRDLIGWVLAIGVIAALAA